ncbi:MAG: DUF5050 domain-containing protein [Clostridium sp.]|nr:DUF5050 domain-containing protein [Clostridium sp.]
MFKKIIPIIIASSFLLVGCSKADDQTSSDENKTNLTTSYKKETDTSKRIILSGKTSDYTKYSFLGNLLFFPDPNNDNKLSVAEIKEDTTTINESLIKEGFNYSVDSLVSDGNYIYFSSISVDKGVYKLDYQKKEITKLIDNYTLNLVYQNDFLYYIDSLSKGIYSFNLKTTEKKLLSSKQASEFILNNNSIFYKNIEDSNKLYCLKTDASANFKLTDYPVDSFVIYNNFILFSNTAEKNYVYSIDASNLEVKKVLSLSTSKLKQYENTIYFINNDDPNSIYKISEEGDSDELKYEEVFSSFTNDYFPYEDGLFIEAASNINEVTLLKNK